MRKGPLGVIRALNGSQIDGHHCAPDPRRSVWSRRAATRVLGHGSDLGVSDALKVTFPFS